MTSPVLTSSRQAVLLSCDSISYPLDVEEDRTGVNDRHLLFLTAISLFTSMQSSAFLLFLVCTGADDWLVFMAVRIKRSRTLTPWPRNRRANRQDYERDYARRFSAMGLSSWNLLTRDHSCAGLPFSIVFQWASTCSRVTGSILLSSGLFHSTALFPSADTISSPLTDKLTGKVLWNVTTGRP